MIESRKTKAQDVPRDYECHDSYKTCTRDDYENNRAYDWRVAKKEDITRKFRLEDPKFDGYPDLHVFSDWLADMECYFDCYEMFDVGKIRFDRMSLVGLTGIYWTSIRMAHERQRKNLIESWEEMKDKLKDKYFPEFYRNRLWISYIISVRVICLFGAT